MVYSQQDPTWAHILLGFNTSSLYTIGTAGCYVTAIANVCSWAGHDLNPQQVNDICKQNNWFVDGGLISRDDIPALLCSNLGFTGRTNWSGPTDINFFNDASSPDVAYIIEIDASKAPGIQTHFTMVWSKPDASDLEIDDSWDGVRKALSHYGSPSAIILSAIRFVKVSPVVIPVIPVPVSVPEPVTPPPVVPPPAPPSPTTITSPVTASSTAQYSLVASIPYYPSPGNAVNRTNSNGNLANGAYYIFNQQQGMYSLTKTLGQSQGAWINPADNVVKPPKPVQTGADIQKSFKWFFATHEPVTYKILQDLSVQDILHGSTPVPLFKDKEVEMYGTFEANGNIYLRPLTGLDDKGMYSFYGVKTTDIYSGAPYLDNEYNVADIVTRWESFYDKAVKTIEGIFKPKGRR